MSVHHQPGLHGSARVSITRRSAIEAIGTTMAAYVFAACTSTPAPSAPQATAPAKSAPKETESVVLRLDWLPAGYHAPFYVAREKGWYSETGLDVVIGEAKGSGQAAQLVGAGDAMFGHVEGGVVVKSIATGLPIKSVALPFAKTPLGYSYAKDLNIKTPKDLEGKRYGAAPASATFQLWPAFAAANGIDSSKVTVVNVDPATATQAFASKQVDFLDTAVAAQDWRNEQAGRLSQPFLLGDYGLSYVGHAIVTNLTAIQQKADTIRRFLAASFRGYDYTREHPGEAIDIFLKANPDEKRGLAEAYLLPSIPLWTNPIGVQTEQQWQATIDLISRYAKIEKPPKTSDVYTNDLLPKR